LAWSRTHLFIGASVTDDVIVSATPGKELNGDQLLLLLDTNQANGNGLAADVYRIALLPGNFTGKLPATQLAQGGSAGEFLPISGPGMQIATRQTKTGYDLEAAVPWNVLQLTPAAALEMRALLEAVDSDDTVTAAPEVMYAQLRQRQLDDPTTWGTFILESEP
jgi:hypothetical protein